MKGYNSARILRMEHLNHHGNLHARQGIEWMVETSFIVENSEYCNLQELLYKNTHIFTEELREMGCRIRNHLMQQPIFLEEGRNNFLKGLKYDTITD